MPSGRAHNLTPKDKALGRLRDRFNGKIVLLDAYQGVHSSGKFRCLDCGHETSSTLYEKFKAKIGCRACATSIAKTKTHEQFMEEWLQHPNRERIEVLGRYKGVVSPIRVRCVSCGHEWQPTVNNLVWGFTGCPACAKVGSPGPIVKEVVLAGQIVRVTGAEPLALEWMIARGVPESSIKPFSSGQVPSVPYIFRRRKREYRPDFLLGSSTLVEVKSTWTLLTWLDQNKAKAKACMEAGFKYRLLVCAEGNVVCLPDDWLRMNAAKILAYFKSKTLRTRKILALDPGVVNFGWAVVQASQRGKPQVLASGMITNTVRDLTVGLTDQLENFRAEIDQLIAEFSCNAIAMERYMSRGHGGTTIELVNMMIGSVLHRIIGTRKQFMAIPASQWKNPLNKKAPLETTYSKLPGCTPHQIDAAFIGLYAAYSWFGKKAFGGYLEYEDHFLSTLRNTAS